MNNKRQIILLALLTACSAALVGCADKTTEEETPDKLVIELLSGIGPVRFGMSKDDVIEHFGQPDRIFPGQVTKLNYVPSRGLVFEVDAELGLQKVGCWSEGMLPTRVTTFAGLTKEGIGIGSTQAQVVEAYGQPDSTSAGSRGIIQNLHYDKLGAEFSLKEGLVSQ